jgi:hypothetical protein
MAAPIFKAVGSSNIAALAWDADKGWGWVQFKGGSKFAYDMPQSLFDEMAEATSVGTFFARHVKSKFKVMATWQACGIEGCAAEALPNAKPLRCAAHTEKK